MRLYVRLAFVLAALAFAAFGVALAGSAQSKLSASTLSEHGPKLNAF